MAMLPEHGAGAARRKWAPANLLPMARWRGIRRLSGGEVGSLTCPAELQPLLYEIGEKGKTIRPAADGWPGAGCAPADGRRMNVESKQARPSSRIPCSAWG